MGTWVLLTEDQKLYWSDETYRIHDMEPGTPISLEQAVEFYYKEDREVINKAVDTMISNGKSWDLILRIVSAKNVLKTVRAVGRPIFNEKRELIRLEGVFQEINVSKESGHELMALSKRNADFEEAFDQIAIIARTDADGKIIYANDMFVEISGYERSELLGKDHRILNSGHHDKSFFQGLWGTITKGKVWRGEIRNRRKNGEFYWVETIIKPILNERGEIVEYLSVRRDITYIKEQYDADLKTTKLAAIGETTAQIVHDVMNPLAIILANIERIEMNIDKPEKRDQLNKNISRVFYGVERIQDIFGELRSSLTGGSDVKRFSFRKALEKVVTDLNPLISQMDAEVSFDTELDFDFLGNESQIRQVFENLIKNSLQAIEDKDKKWVRINLFKLGSYRVIQITDSGTGIPEAVQEKMWDSLFTTKDGKGGTGLGLGICKKIIEAHNGKISVNKDSVNTQFEIVFKDA
jgi:PAS domain S-box-containing protein